MTDPRQPPVNPRQPLKIYLILYLLYCLPFIIIFLLGPYNRRKILLTRVWIAGVISLEPIIKADSASDRVMSSYGGCAVAIMSLSFISHSSMTKKFSLFKLAKASRLSSKYNASVLYLALISAQICGMLSGSLIN